MTPEEKAANDAMNSVKLDLLISDMKGLNEAVKELARNVNRLAVIEERQSNTADSLGRAFKEIEKHDARIKTLEGDAGVTKQSSDMVNKVITIIITAVTTAVVGLVVIQAGKPTVPATVQSQK